MLAPEDEPVILIQILAALLLVLGSGLLLHALVALDAPSRPRALPRRRFDRVAAGDDASDERLPRAA
jgi:hypothetical protein